MSESSSSFPHLAQSLSFKQKPLAKNYQIVPKANKLSINNFLKPTIFKINNVNKKLENFKEKTKKTESSFGSSKTFNLIRVLLKAMNLFRFRTKFRTLRFLNKRQIELIDDISHLSEKPFKGIFLKQYTQKNVNISLIYLMF